MSVQTSSPVSGWVCTTPPSEKVVGSLKESSESRAAVMAVAGRWYGMGSVRMIGLTYQGIFQEQWGDVGTTIGEWGAVVVDEVKLSHHRGKAGLDSALWRSTATH